MSSLKFCEVTELTLNSSVSKILINSLFAPKTYMNLVITLELETLKQSTGHNSKQTQETNHAL